MAQQHGQFVRVGASLVQIGASSIATMNAVHARSIVLICSLPSLLSTTADTLLKARR